MCIEEAFSKQMLPSTLLLEALIMHATPAWRITFGHEPRLIRSQCKGAACVGTLLHGSREISILANSTRLKVVDKKYNSKVFLLTFQIPYKKKVISLAIG